MLFLCTTLGTISYVYSSSTDEIGVYANHGDALCIGVFSTMLFRLSKIEDAQYSGACKHKTPIHIQALWSHVCLIFGVVGDYFPTDNTFVPRNNWSVWLAIIWNMGANHLAFTM